jgi:CelD/BcsL family acetyltransferase involved in cellulose biosynthesis
MLIRKLLEYAHEARLLEFDFTTGGEMYKKRFANLIRTNSTLHLQREPGSIAGQFRRFMMRATGTARKIKEELKARPRLYRTLKRTWLRITDFASH